MHNFSISESSSVAEKQFAKLNWATREREREGETASDGLREGERQVTAEFGRFVIELDSYA